MRHRFASCQSVSSSAGCVGNADPARRGLRGRRSPALRLGSLLSDLECSPVWRTEHGAARLTAHTFVMWCNTSSFLYPCGPGSTSAACAACACQPYCPPHRQFEQQLSETRSWCRLSSSVARNARPPASTRVGVALVARPVQPSGTDPFHKSRTTTHVTCVR